MHLKPGNSEGYRFWNWKHPNFLSMDLIYSPGPTLKMWGEGLQKTSQREMRGQGKSWGKTRKFLFP